MNYLVIYNSLINRAKLRKTVYGYSEKHHVIPKCLGGSNEPENIVVLTAEEHYLAHQLLVRIHPDEPKILYAAVMLCFSPTDRRINNKVYGWLKKKLAVTQSEKFKGRSWSSEQNENRAKTVRAQWADPEFRAKRCESMRGRKWSDSSKSARSDSMKGKLTNMKSNGRKWTAEQKLKLSETMKRKFAQNKLLKGIENAIVC